MAGNSLSFRWASERYLVGEELVEIPRRLGEERKDVGLGGRKEFSSNYWKICKILFFFKKEKKEGPVSKILSACVCVFKILK